VRQQFICFHDFCYFFAAAVSYAMLIFSRCRCRLIALRYGHTDAFILICLCFIFFFARKVFSLFHALRVDVTLRICRCYAAATRLCLAISLRRTPRPPIRPPTVHTIIAYAFDVPPSLPLAHAPLFLLYAYACSSRSFTDMDDKHRYLRIVECYSIDFLSA